MARALRRLDRLSPTAVGIIGGFLICCIGVLSYVSGPQLSGSFLYLIPILLITRVSGFRPGVVAAVLAAIIWLVAELNAGIDFGHPVFPYWNFGMRLGTFLVAVSLVASMRSLNAHLEDRVFERTAALEAQITENRELEETILNISDKEQATIGQDLHDGLCQQLVGAAFSANMLFKRLEIESHPAVCEASGIADMIDDAITQARNLARGLYPVRLETDGLEMALRELAATSSRRFDIGCGVECITPLPPLRANSGIQLYRIAQEAVVNAAKHAKAREIMITLSTAGSRMRLEIDDDGIGLPHRHSNPEGMGLKIMEYRARMIGAEFSIRNRSQGGTSVSCEWIERVAHS